jgi:hypothetical protein
MKIQMEALSAAYDVVEAVGSHAGLLPSQFVRVQAHDGGLKLNLTGLAIGEATVPAEAIEFQKDQLPGTDLYLDRRLFGGFLSLHKRAETVRWKTREDGITLTSGTHRLDISGSEFSGYQTWRSSRRRGVRVTLTEEELQQLVLLRRYTSETAAADHLNAIRLISNYGALATDMYAMAVVLDKKTRLQGFFPSLLPGMISGGVEAVVEKNGTAVLFPNGYLYQPVSENCAKSFPEKNLRQLVGVIGKAKPAVVLPLKTLRDVFGQLMGFVFGSVDNEAARVECVGSASKNLVTMRLQLTQGKTERSFRCRFSEDFSFLWSAKYVAPWVEKLPDVDTLACYQMDFGSAFVGKAGRRTYVLSVAAVEG